MVTHTKGPWKMGPRNAGDGANISDAKGRYIAHTSAVRNLDGNRLDPKLHIEREEALSNARLITKAPTLHSLLTEALAELEANFGGPQDQNEEEASLLARIREALS